jgi:hypothetical protein
MTSRDLARADARIVVAQGIGAALSAAGFSATRSGLRFIRRIDEGRQVVDATPQSSAAGRRVSILMSPMVRIDLLEVARIKSEMAGGDARLGAGSTSAIVQPADTAAPQESRKAWYLTSRYEMDDITSDQKEFFETWVVPFLDEYVSAEALVTGYRTKDHRLAGGGDRLSVVAALVHLGRREEAQETATLEFGAKGLRDLYAPVFRYFSGTGA